MQWTPRDDAAGFLRRKFEKMTDAQLADEYELARIEHDTATMDVIDQLIDERIEHADYEFTARWAR